jgi:hypothetical protein
MTISLCLPGVSMIVLSRVLAFVGTSVCSRRSLLFLRSRSHHIIAPDVNFY